MTKKHNNLLENTKNRIWELDFIRGVAVVLMIFDHLMYDLGYIFYDFWQIQNATHPLAKIAATAYNYRFSIASYFFRIFLIAGIFLFVSGICAHLSRNNYKRGFRLLIIAIALSMVSWLFSIIMNNSGFIIYFGILHCLSAAMLLTEPIKKIPKPIVFLAALMILAVGFYLDSNKINAHYLLIPFNITPEHFVTADYYPLFPFLAFYLLGYLFGGRLYRTKQSHFQKERNIPPFNHLGRNALLYYFLHQIVIIVLLYLAGFFFFGTF